MEKWTKEKIWDWYNSRPWMRGCNYIPADCCNRIEMWQALDFEKHLETMEQEFALMQSVGYNSIRVILEYIVYEGEHDSFMERFERFLSLADKYGISVMVCFGNDCTVPKNSGERTPRLGPQEYDIGYHGGKKISPHGSNPDKVGYSLLDEPESAEGFFRMVREIVTKYAGDERICIWDLFNEPGANNRGEISVPHVRKIFETARECNPCQPLTSGTWHTPAPGPYDATPAEYAALELSDIISFHCYGGMDQNVERIHACRKWGRPMLNTEWLNRCSHNNVNIFFPLYYLEKIGCWNWGFVAGKTQTYEPWESYWRELENNPGADLDITKWQHDLFRPNLRPYDPMEITYIKAYSAAADKDFAEQRKEKSK